MTALSAKKYASSYGRTPPLLLNFAPSTLDLEELQNTSRKLIPIVAAEVVQNMLLRREEFVPHNSAQWVAMRNFQLRHLRYGECATLSNGLLTEIVKETAYQTGEMQVSQLDINPKNPESFRRGLDHTAILLELDGRRCAEKGWQKVHMHTKVNGQSRGCTKIKAWKNWWVNTKH